MKEQAPEILDEESFEYINTYAKKAKRFIGASAIFGATMMTAAGAEAIFDFTDQITTFVASGMAISMAMFTGSKIGYLYKIHQASKEYSVLEENPQ